MCQEMPTQNSLKLLFFNIASSLESACVNVLNLQLIQFLL